MSNINVMQGTINKRFQKYIENLEGDMLSQSKWVTFDGRVVSLWDTDHQHLSNIYWHSLIVKNVEETEVEHIKKVIDKRFDGEILPYRPNPDFKIEVDYLVKKHFLVAKGLSVSDYSYDIIYRGEIVGELLTTEKILNF